MLPNIRRHYKDGHVKQDKPKVSYSIISEESSTFYKSRTTNFINNVEQHDYALISQMLKTKFRMKKKQDRASLNEETQI